MLLVCVMYTWAPSQQPPPPPPSHSLSFALLCFAPLPRHCRYTNTGMSFSEPSEVARIEDAPTREGCFDCADEILRTTLAQQSRITQPFEMSPEAEKLRWFMYADEAISWQRSAVKPDVRVPPFSPVYASRRVEADKGLPGELLERERERE